MDVKTLKAKMTLDLEKARRHLEYSFNKVTQELIQLTPALLAASTQS